MLKSRTLFGRPQDTDLVAVDRAISEFRAGRPVLLRDGASLSLALAAELADSGLVARLNELAQGNGHLVLTAPRLRRLGARARVENGIFAMPTLDMTARAKSSSDR